MTRTVRVLLVLVLAVGMALALEVSGVAQCSMCRASLAGANGNFVRNFNLAVLVLLTPPVAIFCALFLALRKTGVRSYESRVGSRESGVRRQDAGDT